ncbi:MAG: hypothetical protein GX793_10930, partial [Bacteroidales bacterium]|nr:hypothetical protein [Bacteroidales bacterium]
ILDSNTLFRGRRIIESTNYVLRNFSGQSVLVEAGFISNEDDLTILKTKTEEVGQEVAAGIINYLEGP